MIWTIVEAETQKPVMTVQGARSVAELNVPDGCVIIEGGVSNVAEEQSDEATLLAERARVRRDKRLQSSDWTQVPDAPVDQAAWQVYRQALRDITEQEGFPLNIIWPQPPQ